MSGHLCTQTFRQAQGILGTRGEKNHFFKSFFSKKHFLLQITVFFFKTTVFKIFFQKRFFFHTSSPPKKDVFQAKKFYFGLNVNIFKTFHLIFVKKNHQNRESVGKGAAIEKSREVIGRKKINERALFVYNLSTVDEFFFVGRRWGEKF